MLALSAAMMSHTFEVKPVQGRSIAYTLRVETDVQGLPSVYQATVIEHVRAVLEDGTFEVESHQVDATMLMGEDTIPMRDAPSTIKHYSKNGVPIRVDNDPNPEDAMRITRLNAFVPSGTEVATGGSWTSEIEELLSRGAPAVRTTYRYIEMEKHGTLDVARIEFEAREIGVSSAASSRGVLWIDPANGAMMKLEANMSNIALAGRLVNARMILVAR